MTSFPSLNMNCNNFHLIGHPDSRKGGKYCTKHGSVCTVLGRTLNAGIQFGIGKNVQLTHGRLGILQIVKLMKKS